MKTQLLNETLDVTWLFTTHLKPHAHYHERTKSFTIEGNEDCPSRVELFPSAAPLVDEQPLAVFVLDPVSLDLVPLERLTEAQWKEKYKDYEGDGSVPLAHVVVEWDDPSETPSEAIARLNQEVLKLARDGSSL